MYCLPLFSDIKTVGLKNLCTDMSKKHNRILLIKYLLMEWTKNIKKYYIQKQEQLYNISVLVACVNKYLQQS